MDEVLEMTAWWLAQAAERQAKRYQRGDYSPEPHLGALFQLHEYARMTLANKTATLHVLFCPGLAAVLASLPQDMQRAVYDLIEYPPTSLLASQPPAQESAYPQRGPDLGLGSNPHRWAQQVALQQATRVLRNASQQEQRTR
jgi:hypothetical protein